MARNIYQLSCASIKMADTNISGGDSSSVVVTLELDIQTQVV